MNDSLTHSMSRCQQGGLTMFGLITGFPSMPQPKDRNHGAKIWLVPSPDIDCAAVPKNMTKTPNYARYMFSAKDDAVSYDYLGD
jgi:hypothetical protein